MTNRGVLDPIVPAGYRVLAVDCDSESLTYLSSSLGLLGYEVTTCETAKQALLLLNQNPEGFDIVLAEAFSPGMDMDGFKLLAAVMGELQSRVQVILFSSFCSYNEAAMLALNQGATAFYTKPIPVELLEHLWQYAFPQKFASFCHNKNNNVIVEKPTVLMSPTTSAGREERRRKRNDDDDDDDDGKRSKKGRVCWLPELHQKFVAAVEFIIGTTDNPTPRKILQVMEKMGVVGLTVQQVSSHLQQYRKTTQVEKSSAELSLEETNYNNSSIYSHTSSDVAAVASASDHLFSSQSQQHSSEEESSQALKADDWSFCLDISDLGVEPEEILNLLYSN